MKDKEQAFTSQMWGRIYRMIGIIILCLLWIHTDGSTAGLFLILFLTITMLLRWRNEKLKWTLILDQMVSIMISTFWDGAVYGLVLSTFDSAYFYCPWISLPGIVYAFLYRGDGYLLFMLMQALFAGLFLWGWRQDTQKSLVKMDRGNKKRYELESLKDDLLTANFQVARMTELSERARIAREIHDHAGHEIIGAYMSLQVVEDLLEVGQEEKEMYDEAMKRLEKGIEEMRQTVHNLAPLAKIGVDYLKKLCEEFTFCPVDMNIYGDTSKVHVYLWSILEPCLKEALTNIMRHSQANRVAVDLDVTSYIVRLSVENDGIDREIRNYGIGLRNVRYRAEAVGGNVSIDVKDGFRLICVLPIE